MKKLFNKRIPTILGILLTILGIPLTTFILKSQTSLTSTASNSQDPQNVKMTNISDKSFTVTYQTDAPSTGSISYGADKKLGESELEDVDKERGSFSPKRIHSISVKKLIPSTKYYLTIISGSNTFLNGDVPFEATTGKTISSASAKSDLASNKTSVIKGKIVLPNGNAPSEALVHLNAENSQLLSSLIAKDGKFNFSLKELRTDDLSSYFDINDNTVFKIFATDGSLKSNVSISLSQTDSLPTITLSNDYDFTQAIHPTASESAKSSGFPSISPSLRNSKLEIINPKENQSFDSRKPRFRGTSLPNEKVEIIIHSTEELIAQVIADNNGNWTYKPSVNLSPGIHTITIKTRDSSGILTTVMRSFTVFAADSQSATPSAVPTQIVTPTLALIPTLLPSPTINIIAPTSIPTLTSSPAFLPIETKGGLPPTGSPPIILIIGGITATLTGLALFFFTHKLSL